MPVPADWTGPNEKRLLNRDTPTTGYVKNGTILGFNRKGYNNGPNLLPSPGYFFRDKLYYPPPPPLAPPYLPGMAFPAEAVYNWGSDEPYCGYVDYTGQEDNYNYSKTPTPDDASYKPRVGVTDPILPGFVEIPGFMSRNVSEAEGKGYKFFDEIWGPETSDARPDFEFFCTPNTDNWNIFAFLVEELGRDSYPAEGIFNRRLKDMNLQIPGVYPWSN
jgi:hypothetical protein